jgi:acetylornithine deacetylase
MPSVRAHPTSPGSEAPRDEAWGLVGVLGRRDGITDFSVYGHIDVASQPVTRQLDDSPWSGLVGGRSGTGRVLRP